MYCGNCGATRAAGRFCPECGVRLESSPEETAIAPESANEYLVDWNDDGYHVGETTQTWWATLAPNARIALTTAVAFVVSCALFGGVAIAVVGGRTGDSRTLIVEHVFKDMSAVNGHCPFDVRVLFRPGVTVLDDHGNTMAAATDSTRGVYAGYCTATLEMPVRKASSYVIKFAEGQAVTLTHGELDAKRWKLQIVR